MKPLALRQVVRTTKAATTLEFALVSTMLMVMIFGSVEVGLIMWTRGTLQAIAAQTARCAAISSPVCSSATAATSYAISQAAALMMPALTAWTPRNTTNTVAVSTGTTCLNEKSGTITTYEIVTINVSPWAGIGLLSRSFGFGYNSTAETVTACYPI